MKVKLSAEEKSILEKLSVEQLQGGSAIGEKYVKILLDIANKLLDNEKEWFLTEVEPDPMQLAKKHYAFKSNLLIMKKMIRIIQNCQPELSRREETRIKRKNA